jgi:hypothetical protein
MADSRSGTVRPRLRSDSAGSTWAVGWPSRPDTEPCPPALDAAMACRSNSSGPVPAAQSPCPRGCRRGHYVSVLVPPGHRQPDTRPRGPTAADTSMAIESSLSACAGHLPSGRRSFRKQRTVNPPIAPARYNFLYSSFKAGLRAACGRPRPAGAPLDAPSWPPSWLLLHGGSHAVTHQHLGAVGAHHAKDNVELEAGGTRRGRHSLEMRCTCSAC